MKDETNDILLVRKELEDQLSKHDWYYGYSDDIRVWRKGKEQSDNITNLYKKYISLTGDKKEADRIYNTYAPDDCKILEVKP